MPRLNHRWLPMRKTIRSTEIRLNNLINKLKLEAVFPEEFADIEVLENVVDILKYYHLQAYKSGRCPFCNSNQLAEGIIEKVDLIPVHGKAPERVKRTLTNLKLRQCMKCGVYSIDGL